MLKQQPGKRWMSLWRHFYDRERTAEELTASMIAWQEKWQWSVLKLNPAACYHVLDWGADYHFYQDPLKEPSLVQAAIADLDDFSTIGPLDVTRGALGDQLKVIRNLHAHFGANLPIVETVFSPLEIAHRLMKGREVFRDYLNQNPQAVHGLLQTITDVFEKFSLACLDAGATGIFFATKWANSDSMSLEEYQEFERPYDLQILNSLAARKALIVLHVCGPNTYLPKMLDYPSDLLSYDFFAKGNPDPVDLLRASGKFVIGGIDPERLNRDMDGVVADCRRFGEMDRWMAGPSCVVLPDTPDRAIQELKNRLWPLL
jgi:uroporphyrinogen decarboxylase